MDNSFINILADKRKNWVQSTKDNNFENGINNLLTELYPENAHFIYELLQNAEDAQATKVFFELTENKLTFKHDGRTFSEKDVEGITSIGQGTKANDINKIGKFGVGFKAVFSYTDEPEIHSGNFHFIIKDLVIPFPTHPFIEQDYDTVMFFPFSRNKDHTKLYNEIKDWFQLLSDNTLLFLENIRVIEFSINNHLQAIKRSSKDDIEITIENKNKKSKWLIFKKPLPKSDKLYVSVAYKLELDVKSQKKKITPVKKGEVSIFFPAEKETSNLKFHLHAPFASTVARDSIKNIEENKVLLELLAQLIGESFEYLKNNELLTLDFLECLPIIDDNLSDFYQPIKNQIKEVFYQNEFLLSESGTYVNANQSFRSSQKIKKNIDVEFFKLLKDIASTTEIYWIKNPNQNNGRTDKFLKELDIEYIEDVTIITLIKTLGRRIIMYSNHNIFTICHNYDFSQIQNIIESKSNSWFENLYVFLNDLLQRNENDKDLRVFIKLSDNTINYHAEDCFFNVTYNLINTNFKIVHPEIYSKEENSRSLEYLYKIGVTEYNIENEVKRILEKLYSGNLNRELSPKTHKKHWKLFIKYVEQGKADCRIFNDYYVFFDKKAELCSPDQIIRSGTFFNNELHFLDGYRDFSILHHDMYEEFKENLIFKKILSSLNFIDNILFCETSFSFNSEHPDFEALGDFKYSKVNSEYNIDKDFYVSDLNFFLEKITIEKSIFLWNRLQEIETDKFFYARYRKNSLTEEIIKPSSLIYALINSEWILGKNGKFYNPKDITEAEISEKLVISRKNDFLNCLELGKNILIKSEEIENAARFLGFSPEMTSELINMSEDELEEFIKYKKEKKLRDENNYINEIENFNKSIDLKVDAINPEIIIDPTSFLNAADDEISSKDDDFNLYKTTRTKIKLGEKEAKEFLFKQYKGFCQICGYTFKQSNRKNYFELFNLYKSSKTIEKGASLSCCSRCHSNIKYGDFEALFVDKIRKYKNLEYEEFILLFDKKVNAQNLPLGFKFIEMDMFKLDIRILNKEKTIFFTEEHFIHFYALINYF